MIYVEYNEYTDEIKGQLLTLASPNVQVTMRPVFVAPVQLPDPPTHVAATLGNSFLMVLYTKPPSPTDNDDGTILLDKLANTQKARVFIHGVPGAFLVDTRTPRPGTNNPYKESVSSQGGGITTDVYRSPDVDVFVDGEPTNTGYVIAAIRNGRSTSVNALPHVRLYHELLHASGLIFGKDHAHWASYPKTNEFRMQRGLGYQRQIGRKDRLLGGCNR